MRNEIEYVPTEGEINKGSKDKNVRDFCVLLYALIFAVAVVALVHNLTPNFSG